MQYKKSSIPSPWEGVDYTGVEDIVVPDQSMSLEEILHRFTRGETLPVGMEMEMGDDSLDNPLNIDLEKLANSDLVDKEEFIGKLRDVQARYNEQEKQKAADAKAKADAKFKELDEKRIARAARELAKAKKIPKS